MSDKRLRTLASLDDEPLAGGSLVDDLAELRPDLESSRAHSRGEGPRATPRSPRVGRVHGRPGDWRGACDRGGHGGSRPGAGAAPQPFGRRPGPRGHGAHGHRDGGSWHRRLHAATSLAERHQLSVYDAAYLWLAIDVDGELATLDRRLARAASAEGVALVLEP